MKGLSKTDKVDIMNSLFGTTGQQAGLILAENAKDLDKLSAKTLKAGKSGKYVSELASKNSQTAKVQMDRFKQTMNAFTMDLGSAFLPAINEAGNKMAKFLTSKDGQKFQKNVADVVGKFANALVAFIEWASKHTGTMKAIGIALAAGFSVVKFAKLVQQINATRIALKELGLAGKFSTQLTNGWDKMLIRLSNGKTRAGKILKGLGKAFKATGRGIAFAAKEMGKAFLKQIKLLGQGIKGIGSGLLKAAKTVGKEAASAGRFLGRQLKAGFTKSVDLSKGLFGKGNGAGKLNGLMQSAHSAGGFKNLSTAGKVGTVAAGAGVAVDTATSIVKAIKDKAGSRKQYENIGTAAGKGIGGAIGLWFGGPAGAAVGSMIGGKVGKWAGDAAKNFQKGWNAKKPPKNFWSLENMGYSAHNMWNGFTKGVSNTIKWFRKNWKEIGVYLISPLAGAINSLYKHNKKFHKWVDGLVKGFKNAWKGIAKWFSNLGKSIQKSWKGMTKWFSKLGKNMVKGLKNAWKGIKKWFSNLGKSVQKSWKGMTKWFTKLGKNMVKGVKSSWKHITKFFSTLAKGVKKAWNVLTGWFKKIAKAEVRGVKVVWKGITSFFSLIAKGVKKAWNILTGWFKRIAQMEIRGYKVIWKTITSWFSGIVKGVQKAWSGMTSFFGKIGKNTVGALKGAWKGVTSWFSDLLDGIKKTFDNVFGPIAKTIGKISDSLGKVGDNIGKVFSGDWGDIHFATGTDWKSRRPIPAILNDGQDSPETNNRESIIHANGSWELLPNIPNLKRALLPGEDVINARDTAKLLKRNVVHFANGTVTLNNHHEKELVTLTRKQYELLKDNAEKRKKKYEEDKKRHDENKKRKEKKDKNPHKGQTLVDKGLLTGASHRVGQAVWISNAVFKRLTTAPKAVRITRKTRRKRKSSTRRKSTSSTRRRSSSSRRKSSTRRRTTSRASVTRRSAVVSTTVKGGKSLTELAKLLKYIAGTHHATVAITKPSGTKNLEGLSKAFKKVSGSHKASFKVTYSGTYKAKKSIDRLIGSIGKLKSKKYKTISLKVKYSGTYKAKLSFDRLSKSIKSTSSRFKSIKSSSNSAGKALKSLGSRVTSVHSRVNSLFKALKKEKFGDAIKKQAEEAVKSLKGKGNFAKQFDSMVKKFKKDLASMVNNSKKEFKAMWNNIEKTSSTGQHKVISDLSSFSTKFKHGWNNLNSGVESSYSHFWSHMKSKARSGLNDVIGVLNSGISKIDTVVGEFGGNKNAVHKVSKLATGTGALGGVRRAITKPTLAILNDGNDSPETSNRETIWDTNTGKFGVVQGRNVPFLLHPGQEVLNATESKMLGFTHFATGTGALKQLYEIAKKNWKNPSKTGNANFGKVTGLKGAVNSLAQGMQKEAQGQALEWWEQLWTMVENKVNDDDLGPATGLLKEVEKLGKGKKYVLGTWGPSTYDCSGLVSRAIQNLYHKGWGRMNVAGLWTHATEISRSEAKPGDPVFWLPDDHVGIYIGGDKYWSAFSPNAHPDIGIHSIKTSVPGVKPTFGRFKGISSSSSDSDKDENVKVKTSNTLQKFIKPQVGPGFWKTIKKIADKYGDQGGLLGAFKLGATETARVKALAKALKKADPKATEHGIAAVIGNSIAESSLNPAIVNEIGATGLWQFAFGRAAALRSYANKHNMSWKNPAAQINYALNADSSSGLFKEILEGHGSVASLAGRFSREYEVGGHDDAHIKGGLTAAKILGYANGGIANKPSIFGEAGPEMAIPLIPGKSTRAYELLGKTATILAGQSDLNQQVQTQEDRKEEHEFMKSVLLLLQQIAGKDGSIDMKVTTPEGRALWEVVKPFSKADQRADEIKRRKGLSGRF